MTIEIKPQTTLASGVYFSTQIIAERARPLQPLLDPDESHSTELIEMCGWCDRFAVAGEWVEVEQATAELHLTTASTLPA